QGDDAGAVDRPAPVGPRHPAVLHRHLGPRRPGVPHPRLLVGLRKALGGLIGVVAPAGLVVDHRPHLRAPAREIAPQLRRAHISKPAQAATSPGCYVSVGTGHLKRSVGSGNPPAISRTAARSAPSYSVLERAIHPLHFASQPELLVPADTHTRDTSLRRTQHRRLL